ncbi:MAG: prepilin-type N-terminal cleavage/methylation domain-containing protein [Gammaproteobacteria bacterium]|nr:prepilin-type N-terminal cleavage/methylation domain-containing protein [Gammaproteobacteria bacterium]
MNTKKSTGFTLIELMIVVAIVAILSAVAWNSYTGSVISARRTDGRSALLNNVTRLEKCKATYGVYNNAACIISPDSADGYYTVAIVSDATSFTLTATPTGVQKGGDTDCETITLTNTGLEGGTGADPDECW